MAKNNFNFKMSNIFIHLRLIENLRNKIVCFQEETKTRKAINILLLTTYGLIQNKYSGIVQKTITINDILGL